MHRAPQPMCVCIKSRDRMPAWRGSLTWSHSPFWKNCAAPNRDHCCKASVLPTSAPTSHSRPPSRPLNPYTQGCPPRVMGLVQGSPGACCPPLLSPGAEEQRQHRSHPSSGVLPATLGLCSPSVLWESFDPPISPNDPHRPRPRHHIRRKKLMTQHSK